MSDGIVGGCVILLCFKFDGLSLVFNTELEMSEFSFSYSRNMHDPVINAE